MIIDVGCETINFGKIERVGSVYGDPLYRRYDVYFTSGNKITIYVDCMGNRIAQMRREDFVRKWKIIMRKYYDIKKVNKERNVKKDENENT
tara:strand:- start:49 stop:321 length:273 start_codon:yes stop_codon:yes gene_type:complete